MMTSPVLHWFLPTNGDSRTDLSLGNAVGSAGSRVTAGGAERAADVGYIGQIARSRLAARVHAAEALLASAAATLDEVTRRPRDADAAARGSVAVAEAKAFGSEVAVEVGSDLFAFSGASAADERYDLSRHWRNARTHASHDPADWKYHHAGNYLLNHVRPPNHGQV